MPDESINGATLDQHDEAILDEDDDGSAVGSSSFFPDLENLRTWAQPRHSSMVMESVLWKRRDVFKNRWRPRWFVLQPDQNILTYYLLTEPVRNETSVRIFSSSASLATNNGRASSSAGASIASNNAPPRDVYAPATAGGGGNTSDPIVGAATRSRATSWESLVTENPIDYDVIPRGTINLLGCTVAENLSLTKPEEHLFVFTIYPPTNGAAPAVTASTSQPTQTIHLAARSPTNRAEWIDKINRVCRGRVPSPTANGRGAVVQQRRPPLRSASSPSFGRGGAAAATGEPEVTQQQTASAMATEDNLNWKAVGNESELYSNLSDSLADRIRVALRTNLAICDEPPSSDDWKILYRNETSSAFQKRSSRAMIKTVSLLDHPPKQVFSLLVDTLRRGDIERNIREIDILKTLNPHTTLNYYRYDAVWPASPREFTVLTHWQVVGKGDEEAIAMVSFSCPEAGELKSPSSAFVRGTLHVNLSLMRKVGHDDDQCHFTRLLSFSLDGGISSHFSSVVISQQAGFPSLVADSLQRNERDEPDNSRRYQGRISDDILVKDIVQRQSHREGGCLRNDLAENEWTRSDSDELWEGKDKLPRLEKVAVLLLAPLVLHWLIVHLSAPYPSLWFLVSAFLAVREVVLLHDGGDVVPWTEEHQLVGPITCHFKVDLKGVLRFIANKKEERQELQTGSSEISVVHILACAVATALKMEESLNVRRVSIPCLFINEFVKAGASEAPSVSIWESAKRVVTLRDVDTCNIQTIANEMSRQKGEGDGSGSNASKNPGSCLILAAPNYENQNYLVADAIPRHPDVRVVAVVGGVHLDPLARRPFGGVTSRQQGSPRPVLSLSITVAPSPQADFISCRRLVEEVQKLLQYPEMCDNY